MVSYLHVVPSGIALIVGMSWVPTLMAILKCRLRCRGEEETGRQSSLS